MIYNKPQLLLAMGYRDDEWVSSILHTEQLHKALGTAPAVVSGRMPAPRLHAPSLGHVPRIWERRLKYGMDLPAARLLHLLDPAYGDSLLFARGRCEQIVATVTDAAFWLHRTRANQWLRRRIVRGLAGADARIAISRQTAREMEQHLGMQATKVIYLGTEPSIFTPSAQPRDAHCLLHVGSTLERKGIDRILRLLAHMPPAFHFLQLGGVFTPAQHKLIAELGLGRRIVQRPASLGQLVDAYQTAGALLFPSRYEGYGVPCVEARLCGTSVLTTTAVPAMEVLGQDPGACTLDIKWLDEGVQDLGSPSDVKRHLDELVHQVLPLMGQQTPMANREFHSWDRVAHEHIELYGQLGVGQQQLREVA